MISGQWSVDSKWEVGSGEWEVGRNSGQWLVVSGQSDDRNLVIIRPELTLDRAERALPQPSLAVQPTSEREPLCLPH